MGLSSGGRRAANELVGWAFVVVAGILAAVYYTELRSLALGALGLSDPAQMAEQRPARTADADAPNRRSGRRVELTAGRNGHFFTEVEINGRPVETMVDSGASMIALTDDDARRAGIFINERDYTHRVSTANGTARVAMVMLDRVSLGNIEVRNVRAAVSEPGALSQTLLGMSFLGRVKTSTAYGRMIIEE